MPSVGPPIDPTLRSITTGIDSSRALSTTKSIATFTPAVPTYQGGSAGSFPCAGAPVAIFTEMIVALGAMPRYFPSALLRPFPAAMPVVVVPWPTASRVGSLVPEKSA